MSKSSYKCNECNDKHHASICTSEKKDESLETERQRYTEETTTNCSNNENIILLETS